MIVEYKTVERINPNDLTAPKKFYAQGLRTKKYDIRALSADISLSTSLSPVDVIAVLESFLEFIPKLVADGKMVTLGAFGSFKISLSSKGSDTAEEVTNENIRNAHFLFTPAAELKKRMANLQFKKTTNSN